jgi:hypothetical protein
MSLKTRAGSVILIAGGIAFAQSAQAQNDCHANEQMHYVPQLGRSVLHHHQGSNCAIVIDENAGFAADCHADPQQHYLPQYGASIWHRHVGQGCQVVELHQQEGPAGPNCFSVGPVTVCP